MLTADRRRQILRRLATDGRVLVAELADEFGVSVDTVRRDLRDLDEAGALRRVHGGAVPPAGDTAPFPVRARRAVEAKASIGARGAGLITDGQVIVLDGGSTTLALARSLPAELRATVITHCVPIAAELVAHPGLQVIVVGGTVRPRSQVATGPATVDAFRAIRPDILFLGVCGLHPQAGITVEDPEEGPVKAAMIDGAAEVVALADHDKLGTTLPFTVAPMTAVTRLVTDADADAAGLAPYRALGIDITGP